MVYAGDPVDTGLVASRARLGGSITGLSGLATDLSGKRLELPGICAERELAAAGGLMAYGSSIATNFRRAATYVAQTQQGCCWPTVLPSSRPSRCRARRRWIWPSREVAAAH